MFRIFFFILVIAGLSFGLSLVADMDGKLIIQWPGGEIQPTLMQAFIGLLGLMFVVMLGWTLFRVILTSPENLSRYFRRKKQEKGLDALSSGLIALGAGDNGTALRYAAQARKTLPNEPMTQMLRAQAAELEGDSVQATRIYESMLSVPDTELMGLRGLYRLALEQSELVAAEQFAGRAANRRPDLSWAVLGLFDLQCRRHLWANALETLVIASDRGHVAPRDIKRQKAVLLTALAMELEESDTEKALEHAVEANRLAPALVPAAVVAGRIYASRGKMGPALKMVRKCWKLAPHPDLAMVSAYARPGDSVRDRMQRIRDLAKITPGHKEAAIAVANAAVEAQDWAMAREVLGPLARARPTQRVCTLLARIEAADSGNKGLVKEWLARAINAPGDPQWVADGVVYDEWAPLSPVTNKLDAFSWMIPAEDEAVSGETLSLKRLLSGLVAADGIESDGADATVISADVDLVDSEGASDEESLDASLKVIGDDVVDDNPDEAIGEKEVVVEAEIVEIEAAIEEDSVESSENEVKAEAVDVAEEASSKNRSVPQRGKKKRRRRTKIYVSPPAPDDPGTDTGDEAERTDKTRPIRY